MLDAAKELIATQKNARSAAKYGRIFKILSTLVESLNKQDRQRLLAEFDIPKHFGIQSAYIGPDYKPFSHWRRIQLKEETRRHKLLEKHFIRKRAATLKEANHVTRNKQSNKRLQHARRNRTKDQRS